MLNETGATRCKPVRTQGVKKLCTGKTEAGDPTLTIAEATGRRASIWPRCFPQQQFWLVMSKYSPWESSINGIHLTERSSLVRDLSHPPLHLTFSTSGEMEGVMVCEPVAFEMNAACFGMPKFRGKPEQPGVNPFQPSENSLTALSWSISSNLSSGWMLTLSSSFSWVAGGSHSKSSTEEVTPELLDVVHTHTHRTKWHTHCHVAASETRHWLNCKPS